ncbi:MAG: CADD family putative folate metabolism protein [Bdellovibrionales bacterium]|nr:CADD family putative folate metabolism protein [Bdellovibrionales bacterium]
MQKLNTLPSQVKLLTAGLIKHPFYQAWTAGILSHDVLRSYATQYYFHVDCFPRYLSAIHSVCESQSQRKKILEKLNEEEGILHGTSHPELWLQFAEGLGVRRDEILAENPGPAVQNVISLFFRFSRSSFEEGLGALYAYESQVPEIAESKLEGLRLRYGIDDEKTLSFFEVHRKADIEHRSVILEMLEKLPFEKQRLAQSASIEAAQSLWDFLTTVQEERETCVSHQLSH